MFEGRRKKEEGRRVILFAVASSGDLTAEATVGCAIRTLPLKPLLRSADCDKNGV